MSAEYCLSAVFVLAEGVPEQSAPGWGGLAIIMLPALIFMVIAQVFFGRSESKEKAKRDKLIGSLKKNDPIVTIGGILGTVVNVSDDKQEVTVRVDDGARIRFQASAIREVIARDTKDSEKSSE